MSLNFHTDRSETPPEVELAQYPHAERYSSHQNLEVGI
jgi:hypothetical protein